MRYAGLDGGVTCRCGDGYNREGTNTGCTITCNGDLYEKCGGSNNKASVYEVMVPLWNNTVIGMANIPPFQFIFVLDLYFLNIYCKSYAKIINFYCSYLTYVENH